ncbi:MAG: hypothetical protein K0S76_381 [Herbinix sp.]|jgi:hypothetical protein|nr:hypothetical protein [Herbinix sp.]
MIQNKVRYLLLLTSMGFLSILYNQYVMGIIFLTILIMPFILFALLSFTYGYVTAELVSAVHVANKGEVIPISIQLRNPTIFPVSNMNIYINYQNAYSTKHYKKEITISIDRRTNTIVTCNLQSEFSGNLEISITGIRLYDYMRIFSLKKKLKGEIKVAILPQFHEMLDLSVMKRSNCLVESDYYSPVKSGDDPSEVFAIREYMEGDRPQRIHWKLSMKQDQLMIKDFSEPMNCSVLIFANLKVPKEEGLLVFMDALLECALSLSYSFLQQKQIHYFAWFDEKHGVCRRVRVVQEKDLFEVVDGLLQAAVYTDHTDAISAYLAEHPNGQYTDFYFVTGDVSGKELDSISLIRSNARQMIHVHDVHEIFDSYDSDKRKLKLKDILYAASEMGIGLIPVDIGNVKDDMEQLKLS